MSEVLEVPVSEVTELEAEGREILARRTDEVIDEQLDGDHWFWGLLAQAHEVIRRQRSIAARRRART